MAEDFLPDDDSVQEAGAGGSAIGGRGDREPVLITVSGSRRGITAIIHQLYSLGFAQIHEWSKPQNHPQTGDLFCVLTKYVRPE